MVRSMFDVCVLALALAMPCASLAGSNRWTSIGPDGGQVRSLAVHPTDPTVVFAGTVGGVYRSTDSGQTWESRSRGLGKLTVWAIVIDPANPEIMVAQVGQALSYGNVFRTENGGRTWQEIPFFEHRYIRLVTHAPEPFTVYVRYGGSVYSSTDSGLSWSRFAEESGLDFSSLAVHPGNSERLVTTCWSNGAWASDDGGLTWRQCGEIEDLVPWRVAFDPLNADVVYLASVGVLYRSDDGCRTWNEVNGAEVHYHGFFIGDPHRENTVYSGSLSGVHRSTNGGLDWQPFAQDLGPLWALAMQFSPVEAMTLYLAGHASDERRGVFHSSDAGESWSLGMEGLEIASVAALELKPDDVSTVYAGTNRSGDTIGHGVYRSTDLGVSWDFLDSTEGAGYVLATDAGNPDVLLATTNDDWILKSTDSGETWFELGPGVVGERIYGLEVDPSDPMILYANTSDYRLHRSDDGGLSWSQIRLQEVEPINEVTAFFVDSRHSGVVFAQTYLGIFKSTDRGSSWTLSTAGLETPEYCQPWWCPPVFYVSDMLFDPARPELIIAATDTGPFRSVDGGTTWQVSRDGFTICCEMDGTWSDDCPSLKKTTDFPIPCDGGPTAFAIDRDDPAVYYATSPFGTYRSDDQGLSWTRITRLMPEWSVRDLVSPRGGELLGATSLSGVVKLRNVEEVEPEASAD